MLFTNPIFVMCWWDNQLQSVPQLPDRARLSNRHSVIFFILLLILWNFRRLFIFYAFIFVSVLLLILYHSSNWRHRTWQAAKNSLEAIKPVFLFLWLTLLLFDFYTNLAVILHAVYIYAKSKSLLLRACTVKATFDKCIEQGGFCCRALLLQQRPRTCIL